MGRTDESRKESDEKDDCLGVRHACEEACPERHAVSCGRQRDRGGTTRTAKGLNGQPQNEQTAYDLTKAMFENLDDAHSVSAGLTPLTLENAFVSLQAPLHPGALRYYDEVGAKVPDHLRGGS